jgi:putative FmdB family regulatory protein
MPIYEYLCTKCGHGLEALQKISDDPLKTCPACEQDTLKKKISAAAFRLSGSGWYETDFKSDRKKNLAQGDSAADSSGKAEKDTGSKSADEKKPSSSGGNASGGGKEAAA